MPQRCYISLCSVKREFVLSLETNCTKQIHWRILFNRYDNWQPFIVLGNLFAREKLYHGAEKSVRASHSVSDSIHFGWLYYNYCKGWNPALFVDLNIGIKKKIRIFSIHEGEAYCRWLGARSQEKIYSRKVTNQFLLPDIKHKAMQASYYRYKTLQTRKWLYLGSNI